MCRGCVVLFVLFLLAEGIRAQPIHLAIDSFSYTAYSSESILELQNYVINDHSESAAIQWLKTTVAPDSWTVNLCDVNACYSELETSATLFLDAGDSSQLKAQFFMDSPGEALLSVSVNALDSNDNIYSISTSYAVQKLYGTSVPEVNKLLRVFPNPADQQLTIINESYEQFELSSIDGKSHITSSLAIGTQLIDVSTLESGLYILSFLDKKQIAQRVKIYIR